MKMDYSFNKNPLALYETIMLNHFSLIGSAMKHTPHADWNKFGGFLIDKYAIHSASLFHLMEGLIEHTSSSPQEKKMGYDVFSINTLFRSLIETYATFHLLFVYPQTENEKHFRFLLWQLDGLREQQRFRTEKTDFTGAEQLLISNQKKIDDLCREIEQHPYLLSLQGHSRIKLFDPVTRKPNWKFRREGTDQVKILKIIEFVELTCTQRSFINLYQYASMHTHSGYLALENFEKVRGKILSSDSTDPMIRQAILLTFLVIKDMCQIDKKALEQFLLFPSEDQYFINRMVTALRDSGGKN